MVASGVGGGNIQDVLEAGINMVPAEAGLEDDHSMHSVTHSAEIKSGAHFGHWVHWDDMAWAGGGALGLLAWVLFLRRQQGGQ